MLSNLDPVLLVEINLKYYYYLEYLVSGCKQAIKKNEKIAIKSIFNFDVFSTKHY